MGEYILNAVGAKLVRSHGPMLHLEGDLCTSRDRHANFPPDDACKQCDPDTARVDAIRLAAIKAGKDLETYTIDMLIAQHKEKMLENSDFLNELTERGIPISFSR